MLQYINWDIDPIIVKLGSFQIRYYSLLFAASFYFGYNIIKAYFLKAGRTLQDLDKVLVYMIVAVVAGARLGHCLFYEPDYYLAHFWEMILPFSFKNGFQFTGYRGLASHGAAIGILTAMWFYSKKYKFNYLWIIDKIVVVVALSGFFIRTGNFMNSEIVGQPYDGIFAVVFKKLDSIPRHPAQMYEAIAYLFIFLCLYFGSKKFESKIYNGFGLGFFLITAFSARFLIEFVKENQVGFEDAMTLNMGQILSIPLVFSGVLVLIFSYKKKQRGAQ